VKLCLTALNYSILLHIRTFRAFTFFSKQVYARAYVRMSGHALVYPHQIEVKCLESQICVVYLITYYSILN